MTVKELKQKLEGIPDYREVFLMQTDDESPYNIVNTVELREITFSLDEEDENDEDMAVETVLAITDEI